LGVEEKKFDFLTVVVVPPPARHAYPNVEFFFPLIAHGSEEKMDEHASATPPWPQNLFRGVAIIPYSTTSAMAALQFLKGNLGEKKNDPKRDSGHFGAKAPTGKLPTKAPPMEPIPPKQPAGAPVASGRDGKEEMDWVAMISGPGGGPGAVAKY
jgi:hypothetical protein